MDSADRKFCDLFGNPSMSTQLKASVYFSIIVWQYFRSGRFNFRSFGAGCANIVINLWMSTGIWCATTTTTHLKTLPTDKDTGRNYAFELIYIYAGLFGTREQDQTLASQRKNTIQAKCHPPAEQLPTHRLTSRKIMHPFDNMHIYNESI